MLVLGFLLGGKAGTNDMGYIYIYIWDVYMGLSGIYIYMGCTYGIKWDMQKYIYIWDVHMGLSGICIYIYVYIYIYGM